MTAGTGVNADLLFGGSEAAFDLLAKFDRPALKRLIARVDACPLFAHSYSDHLNMRFGKTTPFDLLHFADQHALVGVKIHVEDGEEHSLLHMNTADHRRFRDLAAQLGLRLHIETSSTTRPDLAAAVAIARDVGGVSIRCYPRYEGKVSEIIRRSVEDLKLLRELDPKGEFLFTLEQHEDLKSSELVRIIQEADVQRLSLLFDFGNMTNAYERPAEALAIMAPFVTEVHIKDVKIVEDRGGWGHLACRSGEGDLDFASLLISLLMLGNTVPQVTAFALEEEVDMYAPAYRFPDEDKDPYIPAREPSTTALLENEPLAARLERERHDAIRQVAYVRTVLGQLRAHAASLHHAMVA